MESGVEPVKRGVRRCAVEAVAVVVIESMYIGTKPGFLGSQPDKNMATAWMLYGMPYAVQSC